MSAGPTAPGSAGAARPRILDPSAPGTIESVVAALHGGSVVVIPTDTVYGVAAALDHSPALDRIFEIKGRATAKPLPVLISSSDHLRDVSVAADERLLDFAARFWPGALTIVLPARPSLPVQVVGRDAAGEPTVGVRIPAHSLAVEIIERCGGALAVTSANRSEKPPARTGVEAAVGIGPAVDLVVDGGLAAGGVASSVVAFDGSRLRVLREGGIPRRALETAWEETRRGLR